MTELIKKFKNYENRVIILGKLSTLKNLFYFLFKILVGIVFESWFLIAIAIYSLCIGFVKANCVNGISKKQDAVKNCKSYIRGGAILTGSSIFYLIYTIYEILHPTNYQYSLIVAIAIACYALSNIIITFIGLFKTKGRTMLIKEYKLTNFATAFNNILLAQIAICSFTMTANASKYNMFLATISGLIILSIGMYLMFDGLLKRKKCLAK